MPTTTHLVCAPDDLASPAVVTEWLAPVGLPVNADAPLVRLAVAGEVQLVLTPLDGVLTEHCVAVGEPLAASDLLAMIEAEELPLGLSLLPDADDEDAQLSLPACRIEYPTQLPDADSLALCAALGLAPDEVSARRPGQPSRQEVERHVRRELRLLASLRRLLDGQDDY